MYVGSGTQPSVRDTIGTSQISGAFCEHVHDRSIFLPHLHLILPK